MKEAKSLKLIKRAIKMVDKDYKKINKNLSIILQEASIDYTLGEKPFINLHLQKWNEADKSADDYDIDIDLNNKYLNKSVIYGIINEHINLKDCYDF